MPFEYNDACIPVLLLFVALNASFSLSLQRALLVFIYKIEKKVVLPIHCCIEKLKRQF